MQFIPMYILPIFDRLKQILDMYTYVVKINNVYNEKYYKNCF